MKNGTMKRKGKARAGGKIRAKGGLRLMNPRAAGIDIGSRTHYAAVPPDSTEQPVRSFGCLTPQLHELAQWLRECGVTTVALESTGVYWIPVAEVLEDYGLAVKLVNARQVKNVPGRKSDVQDCQWLQELHSFGLLRGSFRPAQELRALRGYWRHRQRLVEAAAQQVLLMQKALEQMNLQLHKVLSDITGMSGMAILRAILAGCRDGAELADLAQPTVKSDPETIAQALTGHWREEHLFALKQSIELYDFYQTKIAECDQELERCLRQFQLHEELPALETKPAKPNKNRRNKNTPRFEVRELLYRLTGVDLTQIDGINVLTAQTIVAECGQDMQAFPSEKDFASWLGLCPNNVITGEKVMRSGTRTVVSRVATALRRAAFGLHHSKSWLGAFYRRMRARLGPAGAITATAHKLACQVYRLLKYGGDYVDQGNELFEQRQQERDLKNLKRRAREMGYELLCPATGELVS